MIRIAKILFLTLISVVCYSQEIIHWKKYAQPTDAGFDSNKSSSAKLFFDSTNAVSLMLIKNGNVVIECPVPGVAKTCEICNLTANVVTISATDPTAIESDGSTGTFTISRNSSSGSISVDYTVSGTASPSDYTPTLSGSVEIADGNNSAVITITPVNDGTAEGTETLALCIDSDPSYIVGSPDCTTINLFDELVVSEKPRVVILTDISNEPDDQQSLVRALMYSNDVDIEGLIAGTSCWKQSNPDIGAMNSVIGAYGDVHSNLLLHSPDYPTADYLYSVAKSGVNGFGMSAAASNLNIEAVDFLISVVDKGDPRPVWFLGWGGTNTLGAAVMKVMNTRSASEAQAFVDKIRGYEIAIQDDGFAYISHNFPDAKLISSQSAWKGISKTTPTFNAWSESWGGNNYVLEQGWVNDNIKNKHGALGAKYLDAVYLFEGDSPSFLYLIPNGMSSPENLGFGGWGGRFNTTKTTNPATGTNNGSTIDNALNGQQDYYMFTEAQDTWTYNPRPYWSNGSIIANPDATTTYTNNEYSAIFRWREDFQYDFAARMDWCTNSFANANHPPVAVFDGDLQIIAAGGSTVNLSANGSSDPDGDNLSYNWMYYEEAGSYNGNISITNENSMNASVTLPSVSSNTDIHIILSVTDDASPNLTRYQRVIITITNVLVPVDGVLITDCPSSDLSVGQIEDLTEQVNPSNATNKGVSWSSSNSTVATVDGNGTVTAQGLGSATITVTTDDGGFTATCDITVARLP